MPKLSIDYASATLCNFNWKDRSSGSELIWHFGQRKGPCGPELIWQINVNNVWITDKINVRPNQGSYETQRFELETTHVAI